MKQQNIGEALSSIGFSFSMTAIFHTAMILYLLPLSVNKKGSG
jgi:hypothetical protein